MLKNTVRKLKTHFLDNLKSHQLQFDTVGSTSSPDSDHLEFVNYYIKSQYPEIYTSPAFSWEFVCCLREYVYQVTPWALSRNSKALAAGEEHWKKIYSGEIHLADHFKFMNELRGGHFCGGTAAILAALAQAFGYEAWYLGSGLQQSFLSHAQTIIKIPYQGKDVYSLHDASINISYCLKNGELPIDYFELLTHLRQGQDSSITKARVIHSEKKPQTIILGFEDDFETSDPHCPEIYGWLIDPTDYEVIKLDEHRWAVRTARTLENFEKYYSKCYSPALEAAGYNPKSIYINLLPFQIEGVSLTESDRLLKRALAIVQSPCLERR